QSAASARGADAARGARRVTAESVVEAIRARDGAESKLMNDNRIPGSMARAGVLLVAALLAGCGPESTSLVRGDQLWADSAYDRAIAEYRLALRETDNDERVVARLAHAYAVTGQFDQAHRYYEELLKRAPEYTDQAVYDYMLIAARSRARARGDRFGMANAVDAASELRPGLPLGETSAALARYYAQTGDAERAVDFFERALAEAPADSIPALLFQLGSVQESRGNCAEA